MRFTQKQFSVICPYLKGSPNGAVCGIADSLLKELESANIRLCMGRHYEACGYYRISLRSDDVISAV